LSNAAWSSFYNVVPSSRRAQVLAFIDGVPGQFGIVLSGVLILSIQAVLTPDQIPWLGAVAALVCLGVAVAIRRRYADALIRALRAGVAEQVIEGGPGLGALGADGQATAALRKGLVDPEPAVRRMAVELLGRLRIADAAGPVLTLVADPDPRVRAAAIAALAGLDSASAAGVVGDLLTDMDPGVRAAAVDAAGRVDPDAVERDLERLSVDPDPGVRGAVAVARAQAGDLERSTALTEALLGADSSAGRVAGLTTLGRLEALSPNGFSTEHGATVVAALDDDSLPVRHAAADVLRARPVVPDIVLALLADGSPRVQEAVLRVLDGHPAEARDTVLAWSRTQVARAGALRRQHRALESDAANGGAVGFLASILERRQAEILGRLLNGLAVLGAPEAGGLIRRCLRSDDPDIRAQAVETLDSIGDAELRRAIVSLLEPPDSSERRDGGSALGELALDPDRWIRALAARAQAERVTAEWSTIRERVRADPDPIVHDALDSLGDGGGPPMPDTAHTLGHIDRMLFLRRVPLFAGLAPEDLQRVASTAVEQLYGPDEVVVRGELGDELVLILDGVVRVVHVEADGTERLVRRYEAGEHFGELAVLREAPRAATVVAEPPGVRGLVIGGEGLTAILRERPDAAMAMLATLATRLSQQ
jgi:HEAT repeat protein